MTVPDDHFHTTRWTLVRNAAGSSAGGRQALSELCAAYYEPVVAFLRCHLRDADAAREMSHGFFAQMLAGGTIHTADPERGRFRSYLLGAVKHFLAHQREAAQRMKRGGGAEPVSLEDEAALAVADDQQLSPEAAFDRQWALTVLSRALDFLRAECTADGRAEFFDQVKPWLMGDATHGDQSALAEAGGMSAASMKMAVHRLKRRFRECVKAELAGTLEDPAMIEEEMKSIFAALGGA